jgi:hypothetical protein
VHGGRRKKKVVRQLNAYFEVFNLTKNNTANEQNNQYVQLEKFRQQMGNPQNNVANQNSAADNGNFSINSMYKYVGSGEKKPATSSYNNQQQPLAQDTLNEAWRRYMRSISSTNSQLYGVMDRPISFENNDIKLQLDNIHQLNLINNALELKQFLRKTLRNIFIEIVPVLPEGVDIPTEQTLTNEDKLRMLIEKNETIKSLIKEFNLSFE